MQQVNTTIINFQCKLADYLILLATSADIQCNIVFIVSFISTAIVTGIRNLLWVAQFVF